MQPYGPMIKRISFRTPCCEHAYQPERIPVFGRKPLYSKEMAWVGIFE